MDREQLLCEHMGGIMLHLDPEDVGRMLCTSKAVQRAIDPFEESYWSCTQMVKTMRRANVVEGKMRMCLVHDRMVEFELDKVEGARQVLQMLWRVRKQHNGAPWSVFVDCVMWPEVITVPIPCYLFRTDPASSGCRFIKPTGWKLWISCKDHAHNPCAKCKRSLSLETRVMPQRCG